ncbi:MAG: plasmid stabilization protein [Bacteroidetes bacterium HGW-Bacteroidetes-12]|jgi:mRNA-degrading endonuclease RelE of RelBE toxin-antitoxin system|nr:MAG: plasmid stabilization protein [Bacteroidetes bacterium HGW-Bacteroidetes-12]
MKVIFLNSFKKDLLKITNVKEREQVKTIILEIEKAENLKELTNLKKLKGYSTAYRIRIGNYRLGFYYDNETIEMARLVKRNDIYKVFP